MLDRSLEKKNFPVWDISAVCMLEYRTLQLLSVLAVVGYGGDSDLFLKQVCFALSVNCS